MNSSGSIFYDNHDPVTAGFLSADPLIQDITSCQSFNSYAYCMNNPLKYSDPSGYILRRPEEPYEFFDWSCYYNYGYRTTPGGGGGGYHSYINSFGNNGYHYNENNGNYYNNSHEVVSWGEVYNNYVRPNSMSREEVLHWLINSNNATEPSNNATRPCHCPPPIDTQGEGNKPDGMVISISFDFAFGGGAGIEIGLVTDKKGGRQWFVSYNANLGYGISFGPNIRSIESIPGSTFEASDYKGYSNGFNVGIGSVGYSNSGDKFSGQWSFDGFINYGKSYKEEGWGYSLYSNAPTYGVIWSNTSTEFIQKL